MVSASEPDETHWQDRRVLVTGATGLLGGWILGSLIHLGAEPICLVRDQAPWSRSNQNGLIARATSVRGDLEDYPLLERTVNEYEIETVFHLGAQTIVRIGNANPLSTFESNVRGTWNILEACRRARSVTAIVVASSDKAYGEAESLPYDESLPLRGAHPYDVSKSCADLVSSAYYQTYALPVSITRCGNFFGPGDLNWNRLVPGTMRSVLRGQRPIIRSDGCLRRDYIYVEDAALAYLHLAEQTAVNGSVHGEAFNFSNEEPRSVVEIVKLVLETSGREDLQPMIMGEAPNEIRNQFLSARKAQSILGWRSRFTIEDGMRRTWQWYEKYFTGVDPVRPSLPSWVEAL